MAHDADSTLLRFPPSYLHRIVLEQPRVMLRFTDRAIKSQPSDFINEIDDLEIITCVDGDKVDPSPPD